MVAFAAQLLSCVSSLAEFSSISVLLRSVRCGGDGSRRATAHVAGQAAAAAWDEADPVRLGEPAHDGHVVGTPG